MMKARGVTRMAVWAAMVLVAAALVALVAWNTEATAKTETGTRYQATDEVIAPWFDISGTGAEILSNADEDWVIAPISFDFTFYGTSYSEVCITSNGELRFGGVGTERDNWSLPCNWLGALAAPHWDDLWLCASSFVPGNAVYYQTVGSPGSRLMIVQWQDVDHAFGNFGRARFEAVLYEGSDKLGFQYQIVNCFFGAPEYNQGGSATVGIQSPLGRHSVPWSYNEKVLENHYAIVFTPLAPPASPVPLTLNYNAEANVEADAGGDWNQYSDTSTNAWAFAYTEAHDQWEEMPDPEGEPMWFWQAAGALAMVGGETWGPEVTLESLLEGWTEGDGWGGASADTSLTGTLGLGTSDAFPAGAALQLLISVTEDCTGFVPPWELTIDDGVQTYLLDHTTLTATLDVVAGQTLGIEFTDAISCSGGWDEATSNIRIDMEVTPEPATLSLLVVGGLALIRRRR